MKLIWDDLFSSSLKFLFPISQEETFSTIVSEAKTLLKAKHGSLLLLNKKELTRVYSTTPIINDTTISPYGRTYKALQTRNPFVMQVNRPEDIHPAQRKLHIKSIIFIPLSYENTLVGVLNIFSLKEIHFTQEELLMLKLFGSIISIAIYKAQEYKKTEDALHTRDTFIAMAAHELRTPITALLTYAQLIQKQHKKGKKTNPTYVQNIVEQALWLSTLTESLLTIDIIKNGRLHYANKKVNLKQVINLAITSFRANHPSYFIDCSYKPAMRAYVILGDFYKLLEALVNILNNAAKFSPNNQNIIMAIKQSSNGISIAITDHGEGISKKDLPRIFEGFYKGGHKQHQGMGLGLFLTKEIITHHHGDIIITSSPNKGTTVTINLPNYDKTLS